MGVIILTLFGIAITLALLEDNLEETSKKRAYWIFCGILVLVAGLREVGIDPDSINYEYAFIHYDDEELSTAIEYSYFIISQILSSIVDDVHILFCSMPFGVFC